jgi:hypothetical protein
MMSMSVYSSAAEVMIRSHLSAMMNENESLITVHLSWFRAQDISC